MDFNGLKQIYKITNDLSFVRVDDSFPAVRFLINWQYMSLLGINTILQVLKENGFDTRMEGISMTGGSYVYHVASVYVYDHNVTKFEGTLQKIRDILENPNYSSSIQDVPKTLLKPGFGVHRSIKKTGMGYNATGGYDWHFM